MKIQLPEKFQQTILGVYQAQGGDWLNGLPALLDEYADRWGLVFGDVFPLSYNFVIEAFRADGSPAVLKAGVPGVENSMEITALELYKGRGMAGLLESDRLTGVMLIERISPGKTLRSSLTKDTDDWATRVAANLMLKLWRPLPENHLVRSLEDWTSGLLEIRPHYGGRTGDLPSKLVDAAISLRQELLASTPTNETFLLHGDLHHENILSQGMESWLAIDPKGVAGDRAYDVCSLLLNPMPNLLEWAALDETLNRRISILSEVLGIDEERLRAWGVVHSTLAVWWGIEDGGDVWEAGLTIAERLMKKRER